MVFKAVVHPTRALLVLSVFLVTTVSAQFYPQNARIDALGGTFIMEDMSDIMRYPAYVNNYKDGAQVTFNGPILGVKSIGELISVGLLANRGFMLQTGTGTGSFYSSALPVVNGIPGAPNIDATQSVPHLLLGIDLDPVLLGFDLFYEYAHSSSHGEATAAGATTTTDASKWIANPGMVASVLFGIDDISLAGKFGVAFPTISVKNDNGTTTTENKSTKGSMLQAGAEATFPVGYLTVTGGADFIGEAYQFQLGAASAGTEFYNKRIAFYGGLEGDLFTAAKWGALYNFSIVNHAAKTSTTTTRERSLIQQLSGGIENSWSSVWVFDALVARGGMVLNVVTPVSTVTSDPLDSREQSQTTFAPVQPRVGIGAKKGSFQFDLTVDPSNWAGLMNGPDVAKVTATLML